MREEEEAQIAAEVKVEKERAEASEVLEAGTGIEVAGKKVAVSPSVVTDSAANPKDIDSTGVVDTNVLAYNAGSREYKATGIEIIVNLGKLTPLSPATAATETGPLSVTVSPDGKSVYVANSSANTVSQFSRNEEGKLTPLSPATAATGTTPYSVTISPDGKSVYVANFSANTVSQFSRNEEGKLTPLSPATAATGTGPPSVTVSPDGKSVYVANEGANTVSQFSRNEGVVEANLSLRMLV